MLRRQRDIILLARVVSAIFTPFYLPMLGMVVMFLFSYMSIFPWPYKLQVMAMTYLFTVLLPPVLISLYRRYHGWTPIELGRRERRMVPYVLSILCYYVCVFDMQRMHMPHLMISILLAALTIQIVCAAVNVWWKISTHTAGIGGVGGALFAFAEHLAFNPVWWLSLVFIVGGMVGSSRMILRQHSLPQVVAGFWVGFVCAALAVFLL